MPERETNILSNYIPGQSSVRDHTETPNVIRQGIDESKLKLVEKAERGELRARLASILDRGIVEDRLRVDIPDDLHGEWCRNDPLEVKRLQTLGFKIDDEYAIKRAIHSDGSSSAIVGDVVFMTCPKEVKEVIDEIRHEQMVKQYTKKKTNRGDVSKEEREFYSNINREGDKNVIAYSDSHERSVTKDDIANILEGIDNQTQVSKK